MIQVKKIFLILIFLVGCQVSNFPFKKVQTMNKLKGQVELKTVGYEYKTSDGRKYVLKQAIKQEAIPATAAGNTLYIPRALVMFDTSQYAPPTPRYEEIVVECKTRIIPLQLAQGVTRNSGGLSFETVYRFSTAMIAPPIPVLQSNKIAIRYPGVCSPNIVINDLSLYTTVPPPAGYVSFAGSTSMLNYQSLIFESNDFVNIGDQAGVLFYPMANQAAYLCPTFDNTNSNDLLRSQFFGYQVNNLGSKYIYTSFLYFELI